MQLQFLIFISVIGSIFISLVSTDVSVGDLTNPDRYNAKEMPKQISPEGTDAPVNVIVRMKITDVNYRYGTTEDYFLVLVNLKVKLSWSDSRLRYDGPGTRKALFVLDENVIWRPPLVLLTVTDASFRFTYSYFNIYPNSTVTEDVATSITVKESYIPDTSSGFSIRLVCLNHTTDTLTLEWNDENPLEVDPREFDHAFKNDFQVRIRTCHLSSTRLLRGRPGNHSCLEIYTEERLVKISSAPLVYVPAVLAVIVSWACFWIEVSSVVGRVAILTPCLLHLVVQKVLIVKESSMFQNIPTLNSWLDACLGFVFCVFFHGVLVTYLYVISKQKPILTEDEEPISEAMTMQEEEEEETLVESRGCKASAVYNHFPFLRIWFNRFPSTPDAINGVCRVLFPLCFLIFICVFFSGGQ